MFRKYFRALEYGVGVGKVEVGVARGVEFLCHISVIYPSFFVHIC